MPAAFEPNQMNVTQTTPLKLHAPAFCYTHCVCCDTMCMHSTAHRNKLRAPSTHMRLHAACDSTTRALHRQNDHHLPLPILPNFQWMFFFFQIFFFLDTSTSPPFFLEREGGVDSQPTSPRQDPLVHVWEFFLARALVLFSFFPFFFSLLGFWTRMDGYLCILVGGQPGVRGSGPACHRIPTDHPSALT